VVCYLHPAFGAENDIYDCRRREEGYGSSNCRNDNTSFSEEYRIRIRHVFESDTACSLVTVLWSRSVFGGPVATLEISFASSNSWCFLFSQV